MFNDLKDSQVRGEIFNSLEQLNHVIADTFGHITQRVNDEKARVDKIRSVLHLRLHLFFCMLTEHVSSVDCDARCRDWPHAVPRSTPFAGAAVPRPSSRLPNTRPIKVLCEHFAISQQWSRTRWPQFLVH